MRKCDLKQYFFIYFFDLIDMVHSQLKLQSYNSLDKFMAQEPVCIQIVKIFFDCIYIYPKTNFIFKWI